MSIQFHTNGGRLIDVELAGKLTGADYDRMAPELERLIRERGHLNMLCEMHDFHGWTPRALWKDTRFGLAHRNDIDRIAMVGEKPWQRWMSRMCGWFIPGEVRYYDRSHADEARQWLNAA